MAQYTRTDLERAGTDGNWTRFLSVYLDLYPPSNTNSTSELNTLTEKAKIEFAAYSSGQKKGTQTAGAKTFVEAATGILKGQESGGYYKDIKESVNSTSAMSMATSDGKILPADQIAQNVFKAGIGQISDEYNNQRKLLEDINTKTGLTGQLSKDFREEISNAGPRLAQLGVTFETLANVAQSLVEKSGRFNLINQQSFEKAAEVGEAYLGSMSELTNMLPDFEKVGIGAKGTFDAVEKAGKSSLNLGLSSQKVSRDLATNIGKLNEYGFQKGVEGLTRMVQKSVEFRLSMDAVSQVAEKVFSPESALELSANLQVLGGAIGDFNDPLKLMYMATNNIEGLQDSIINAASSLATYNQEQGRFEVTGVNLRKVREMAAALGMDYKELTKTAVAAQERLSAKEMLSGLRIDDEDKEFLTNMSQMKNGKMSIELQSEKMRDLFGASEIALEDLDKNQADLLLQYKDEFKKLSSDDIVRGQASDIENIRRDVSFLVKSIALTGTREVQEIAKKMGIDFKNFADVTKETLPKAATLINNEIKGIVTPDNKQTGKVETPKSAMTAEDTKRMAEEEAKKQKEATTQTDKNVKVTNEYIFKGGDALVDGWMREVGKNSSIYNDFHTVDTQSYTTPSTAKR
jgi:hypothetical protein